MSDNRVIGLFLVIAPLSFLSIGGGFSILAEMQHQMVDIHGWMTDREFIDLFAISRVAPGPGTLIATLIGWRVAGWLGVLSTSLAMFVPSSILVYFVSMGLRRYDNASWLKPVERGLAPIAIGLIFAGAYSVLRAATDVPLATATAFVTALIIVWKPIHPLLVLPVTGTIYVLIGTFGLI
jgi:chromate transporter